MQDTIENFASEGDVRDKIIDICREIKDDAVRQIVLGIDYPAANYEKELGKLEKKLRQDALSREMMFTRLVNLAFAYIISKYASLDLTAESNCETRLKHTVENIYNTYNVTDDVVRFVILNTALGLDANESFYKNFGLITSRNSFYKRTDEYINIFKHLQKLRHATFKTKEKIEGTSEWLYKLIDKLSFICDIEIIPDTNYADSGSGISSCAFKIGNTVYPSKFTLVKYRHDYSERYLLLRSIDEVENKKTNEKILRLNYTGIGDNDTSEQTCVFVSRAVHNPENRGRIVLTPSIGMLYSYITGDLLRKRHRMSFCNGLASYKYYGELAASVMDALEILRRENRYQVVENYILPVIKNNFNICKEDCVCPGRGCKFDAEHKFCNKDRFIELKSNLNAYCVSNMDMISVLTILFSVAGCKEILSQIFDAYAQDYDRLFDEVNIQLKKRFSEFDTQSVQALRKEFYDASIEYLSLNLDSQNEKDPVVAKTLKPFKIRAYADALVCCLENLDRDKTKFSVNPNEKVYSIQSRIDLVTGVSTIIDVRSTLRDALKIILTYYSGLANCKDQQLDYEIKAEQLSSLDDKTVEACRKAIDKAFFDGVEKKLKVIGKDPDFYTLFKNIFDDAVDLKSDLSIMLGREMINTRVLKRFIQLDEENEKCYLIEKRRKENGEFENIYECDLDNEAHCNSNRDKFLSRVADLLRFLKGDETGGARIACYPQVLTHTSSRVNVDNTTINVFTVYQSEQYVPKKEYNVITYFPYEISKRYFYIAPKKVEKTRWLTYPILIRCSKFYDVVIKEDANE